MDKVIRLMDALRKKMEPEVLIFLIRILPSVVVSLPTKVRKTTRLIIINSFLK